MANTLATPTWTLKEVTRGYSNNIQFVKNCLRTLSDEYTQAGAKVGDTVKVRLPQRFSVTDGAAFQAQDLYDDTVSVSITNQKNIGFSYSSAEQATDIEDVRRRYVNPAAERLANAIDVWMWAQVYPDVYSAIGTPGSTPSTTFAYLEAGVKLTDLGSPTDSLSAVLDPYAMATIANTATTLFNPSAKISEAFEKGMFGRDTLGIAKWYASPNAPRHTTGTFTASTPVINGANQTGSTLATNGWASGASDLHKGDVFTIAGVYSVNRITGESSGRLQQFTVTADTADSGGAMATLPISPSIVTSGALKTVSGSPANGAAITVLGATAAVSGTLSTTVSPQGMIYIPDAFAFVSADLPKPTAGAETATVRSKEWGIAIRMVEQYQIQSDQNPSRLDVLVGGATINPNFAVRIFG